MELRSSHFAEYFRAVHGDIPFPWQQRLVEQLADGGEWPEVLDLPTASGKTAALDAAVFHLALHADRPRLPAIRIALVVDRRIVVDSAYARAGKIRDALRNPPSTGTGQTVVREVAARLRSLAGDGPPLAAARLRGGAPFEDVWARTPTQPTILCSTVDQVGSRLLFRGYGVSASMRPIHAGLLGEGALVLLDEAHLSQPFLQTLDSVREIGRAGVRTALLTATPGIQSRRRFTLTDADRAHPVLKPRIVARKPAALQRIQRSSKPEDTFAKTATAMLKGLRESGLAAPAIAVVVNRVALARKIHGILEEKAADCDSVLMIGRARGVDRDRTAERLRPFFTGADDERHGCARPLMIVATQCLEVGVDLDLDGLVTQAASLDALRQRFGRLQRGGRSIQPRAAVLALQEDLGKTADDPVYGNRIRTTWEALQEIARGGTVDFGVEALDTALRDSGVPITELGAPQKAAPTLMPAYVDLWAQTSPVPTADPEAGLFLHGAERGTAEVSIVWRDDITPEDLEDPGGSETDRIAHLLTLVPPRAGEMLQLPLWTTRRWLSAGARADWALGEVSDAPQREDDLPSAGFRSQPRPAFRWSGPDHPRTGLVRPRDLRPGDLLVLPAGYGGCDRFGWQPECALPVSDVADEAARPYRFRRHFVRLRRSRLPKSWTPVAEILAQDDGAGSEDLLGRLLDATANQEDADAVRDALQAMKAAKGRIIVQRPYGPDPSDGVVLMAPRGLSVERTLDSSSPTTEHPTQSHVSAGPVSLDDHGQHVEDQAAAFAAALRLPAELARDLRLAAYLHDAGKTDPRFQQYLSGGDRWNVPSEVLAKSGRRSARTAWKQAGLPDGWRHEALSVRLARAHPRFGEANDAALVLWLIGTHHGHGRPFFGFRDRGERLAPLPSLGEKAWRVDPDEAGPESLAFDFEGADWPALGQTLQGRYGVWKLAFLEAILRLSDHRASEAEEKGNV